jgi:Type IV pilus assembly protein PilM
MLKASKGKSSKPTIGLAIGVYSVEAVLSQPGQDQPFKCVQVPVPQALLSPNGDQVLDPNLLAVTLRQALTDLGATNQKIHVSIPGSLVRLVDMPKMARHELYLSLSSEAERYKAFDGSEALVDFQIIEQEDTKITQQRIVFAAIRKDTLASYQTAFKRARISVASMDIDEHNTLRAMATTGVLDSLIAQIGPDGLWGSLFSAHGRIRVMMWQGNQIKVLRELNLSSDDGLAWDEALLDDLTEEIRRTGQSLQGEYPLVWLTSNIPDEAAQELSRRFSAPFTPCQMILPTPQGPQTMQASSAFGAALHNDLNFPFALNLSRGKSLVKDAKEVTNTDTLADGEMPPMVKFMWIGSAVAAALVGVVSIGAMVWTGIMGNDITRLEGEKTVITGRLAQDTGRYNELKSAYELKASLLAVSDKAQIRNQIAVNVGQDLKKLTPPSVWLHTIELADALTVEGDALHHGGSIHFARNLDDTAYTNAVVLSEMKEGFLGENPVYTFKVAGAINLNPSLLPVLPPSTADASSSVAGAAPVGSSPPAQSPL